MHEYACVIVYVYVRVCVCVEVCVCVLFRKSYGVATFSRIDKIIGLLCII